MKYLKYFTNESDYQTFKESEDYVLPNVSFVENSDVVMYNPELQTPSVFIINSDGGSACGPNAQALKPIFEALWEPCKAFYGENYNSNTELNVSNYITWKYNWESDEDPVHDTVWGINEYDDNPGELYVSYSDGSHEVFYIVEYNSIAFDKWGGTHIRRHKTTDGKYIYDFAAE